MNTTIRDAKLSDLETIAAFNSAMALETEGKPLEMETLRAGVGAVLGDAAKGRYWVAERNGETIGQIMVTWEWSDWRNGWFWWIQSVYIAESARRQGVFRALYQHVHNLAKQSGTACGLRLYVEHKNERARNTYLALAMHDANYHILEATFDR
ncbi:MAG: GNAT family N-acetyltransferase [Pseudomonadota bacterium]